MAGVDHYKLGHFEAIDVIERVINSDNLTPDQVFAVGNALKYLLRLGKKDEVADELFKAENYLHRARVGTWIEDARR